MYEAELNNYRLRLKPMELPFYDGSIFKIKRLMNNSLTNEDMSRILFFY